MDDVRQRLEEFAGVSLEDVESKAALLRRVDNKYAVPTDQFARLAERLRRDHQILEIEDNRLFSYSTTYFETPDLRCLTDHIESRLPRFKARTRLYENSGECVFEVKLKRSDDETDKRQISYRREDRRRFTTEAAGCLQSALDAAGLDAPDDLAPSLTTSFERTTLVSRSGSERLTCDFRVLLEGSDGEVAAMQRGLVLVETKSESGDSPADQALSDMGIDPISLSKYRVGMTRVGGADRFGPQPGSELFEG